MVCVFVTNVAWCQVRDVNGAKLRFILGKRFERLVRRKLKSWKQKILWLEPRLRDAGHDDSVDDGNDGDGSSLWIPWSPRINKPTVSPRKRPLASEGRIEKGPEEWQQWGWRVLTVDFVADNSFSVTRVDVVLSLGQSTSPNSGWRPSCLEFRYLLKQRPSLSTDGSFSDVSSHT